MFYISDTYPTTDLPVATSGVWSPPPGTYAGRAHPRVRYSWRTPDVVTHVLIPNWSADRSRLRGGVPQTARLAQLPALAVTSAATHHKFTCREYSRALRTPRLQRTIGIGSFAGVERSL